MMKLHPAFLRKNGKEQFVVLPFEEFQAIQEALEDADDLRLIEQAKQGDSGGPGISMQAMKSRLGMKSSRLVRRRKRRG